jgi:hypothetical protein
MVNVPIPPSRKPVRETDCWRGGEKGLYIVLSLRRYLFEEHSAVESRNDIRQGGLLPSGAVGSWCSPSISGRGFEDRRFLRGDAHEQ